MLLVHRDISMLNLDSHIIACMLALELAVQLHDTRQDF